MDREKVIKSLKWFRDMDSWREGIMIHDDHADVRKQICDNAIALLKEQEAVSPYKFEDIWKCGNCGDGVVAYEELDVSGIEEVKFNYCPTCGRRVLWEGR